MDVSDEAGETGAAKAGRLLSAVASGMSVIQSPRLMATWVGQGSEAEVGNEVHIGIRLPAREMVGKGIWWPTPPGMEL